MPKKKRRAIITCGYCHEYRNSRIDRTNGEIQKYCKIKKEFVIISTGICREFVPNDYFFCEKNGYWLDLLQCIERGNRKKHGCITCKQGKLIRRIYSKYKNRNDE